MFYHLAVIFFNRTRIVVKEHMLRSSN